MNHQKICDALNKTERGERITIEVIKTATGIKGDAAAKKIMMKLVYSGLVIRKQSSVDRFFKKEPLKVGVVRMVLED